MYLLDVSIRYFKYFCVLFVLFVLFVYAVSFVAMLHLHLRWFYMYIHYSKIHSETHSKTEVFICTAVQIILWLFAQVHCRAAFTLSSRLPLFVYTLQLTVLYVAGGDAMLTGEDEGETNTNSLVVQ